MVTPELIKYVKEEFAKGRTRGEVHADLIKGGGWVEADVDDAFRKVLSAQTSEEDLVSNTVNKISGTTKSNKNSKFLWEIVFLVVGLVCVVSWYFYRPQIINFWNSGMSKLSEISLPFFDFKETNKTEIVSIPEEASTVVAEIKDCGVTTKPDLSKPFTYNDNAVLNCLGSSVLACTNAKAVLKDDLFPTIFQVIKDKNNDQSSCFFKLSYAEDSVLVDVTGKKLARQYIECPVSIAKELDESNPKVPIFKAPTYENLGKYASQIYFYGIIGVFIENNVDKDKIKSLGCSGSYIDSVVASYKKIQSN